MRVSRGVTTHGFALNVSPDLGYFDYIVPCGIEDCRVTSMESQGVLAEIDDVASVLVGRFERVFGVELEPLSGIPTPPLAHRIAECGKS